MATHRRGAADAGTARRDRHLQGRCGTDDPMGLALALPADRRQSVSMRVGSANGCRFPRHRRWLDSGKGRSARRVLGLGEKGATTSNSNTFDDEAGPPSAFKRSHRPSCRFGVVFANTISAIKLRGWWLQSSCSSARRSSRSPSVSCRANLSSGRQDEPARTSSR